MVTIPPPAPNRTNPTLFSQRMDDFLAWLVIAVPEFNTLALATGPGSFLDGTVGAPGITFASDLDTGLIRSAANTLGFVTGGVEGMRLTSSGSLLFGSPNNLTGIGAARLTSQGTNANTSQIAFSRFSADAAGPELILAKARGAAVDTYTAANNADTLGRMNFYGADGTQLYLAAGITSFVTTVAAGDVRGNLVFSTGSAAGGAVAQRLTIDGTGITPTVPVLAQNGTLVAPSFSFVNSPNAGMIRLGANILGLVTNSVEAMRITATQQVLFGAGGYGYNSGAGAGSIIAQATSRSTGVTINSLAGDITLVSAAGSVTPFTFTVTNSAMGVNDNVLLCERSGANQYAFFLTGKAAGSFTVTGYAIVGTAVEAPVMHFDIIRSTIN